jgi:type IV secretory pathway VirB6-like protein
MEQTSMTKTKLDEMHEALLYLYNKYRAKETYGIEPSENYVYHIEAFDFDNYRMVASVRKKASIDTIEWVFIVTHDRTIPCIELLK